MKPDLEGQFHQAMVQIHQRAKSEAGYKATVFIGMVDKQGGLATAKQLINSTKPSQGYTALWELGRLDLTVEALVVDNAKWWPLFVPSEIAKARGRLSAYHYKGRN